MTLYKMPKRRHSGFTLVELLVVIGIIVILIGILLPVAANVRKKGWVTSTTQEMSRIGSACQAYYNDFHAYPGPIAESHLDGDVKFTAMSPAPTGMTNVTSSQNLVLGLLGGLYFPSGSTTITYSPTQVTSGPQSLNSLNVKQYTAYMDVTPEELPNQNVGGTVTYTSYLTVRGVAGNTYVCPEFLDHIPIDQAPYYMPILYIRARVAAQGIVTTSGNTISQYAFGQMSMYPQSFNNALLFTAISINTADTSNGTPGTDDYPVPTPPPGGTAYPDSATTYIANPAFYGQPRGKDSFILISAGSDHIFGTTDDIIYSQ